MQCLRWGRIRGLRQGPTALETVELKSEQKNLRVCTWNVCLGARCKLSQIRDLIIENTIDILCLQEVDIGSDESLNDYEIRGYNLEMEIVTRPHKHRTLVYISNRIIYKRRSETERSDTHIIVLHLPKHDLMLASIYRSYQLTQHANHGEAFGDQLTVLETLCASSNKVIILGDFNLDHNRRADPSYHHSRLYDMWKEYEARCQLVQMVDFPTWSRMRRGVLKASTLDHIYTSDVNQIESIEELSASVSDHCPVLACLAQKADVTPKKFWSRNWKLYSKASILASLAKQDWIIKCTEVEDYYDAIEQKLMVAFDEVAPLEMKTLRSNFGGSCLSTDLKRKRKNLLRNAKRRLSPHLYHRSQLLSKRIRRLEYESKKSRIRNTILSGGPHGLWRGYRLAENTSNESIPPNLFHGEKMLTENEEKAQAFAAFFKLKIEDITSKIVKNNTVYNGQQNPQVTDCNFFTLENVRDTMLSLKDKGCYGFDNIPLKVLKDGAEILAPVFHELMNKIYDQKAVPEKWRTSRILPLHKKGDRKKIENYRPISNLCASSKIFEKLILKRLSEVEDELGTDLSGTTQHGFKRNRSTTSAALQLQNQIARAMDEDNYVAVASMDLTAAFDVLDVELLMKRLKILGIPKDVVSLIAAWLAGRTGYVEVDGVCSEYFDIKFGSGQGSILGPVLFNFYIAPLIKEKELTAYADDNYQIAIHKCKEEALKELQAKVIEAEHWMSGSGLKVNIEKTELVVYHRYETGRCEITVGDKTIKSKASMKILGVIFDSRLSWGEHVDYAICNSRKTLHAMKTVRKYFSDSEMMQLLTANVYSKLYYGSAVWLLPNLKESIFGRLFSHSGRILKIIDRNSSYRMLHKKYNRATPKIFSLYQTAINLYITHKDPSPNALATVTLNDRRNERLTFVRNNRFKVGLNLIANRLRSVSNVVDKKWLDLNLETYKLKCKMRIIQDSLSSL